MLYSSFRYYGLFMWFPELFSRMEISGGSPCSLGSGNGTQSNVTGVSSNIYLESFLTAASNLPGNIFTVIVIERIRNGRNILLGEFRIYINFFPLYIYIYNFNSNLFQIQITLGSYQGTTITSLKGYRRGFMAWD